MSTYVVNYEPGGSDAIASAFGSVTFDSDVLGIQTHSVGELRMLIMGLPNINLNGSTSLEWGGDPLIDDFITLSADRRTVSFLLNVAGATDDFRIFVAPVPEPLTLSLFGAGIVGVAALRRRKK